MVLDEDSRLRVCFTPYTLSGLMMITSSFQKSDSRLPFPQNKQ